MMRLLFILLVLAGLNLSADAAVSLKNLKVEYTSTPVGIDVNTPRFSWQMTAAANERNIFQSAYQVVVKDNDGRLVWDSKKVSEGKSIGIVYSGETLKPMTRYSWTVTVWDQANKPVSETSWFESGLMNPGMDAWEGAKWIGGGSEDLPLYSPYLVIYNVEFTLEIGKGSTKAGFIYGANDSRLMDKNKNIYQIENGKNQSYIKVELDISKVDGSESGLAKFNIYRAGYQQTDNPSVPFKSFEVKKEFINNENKNSRHKISMTSIFGQLTVTLDGNASFFRTEPVQQQQNTQQPPVIGRQPAGATVNLNPAGNGGNYIPFGMLCEMGFSVDAGQKATFSDLVVRNNRFPNAVLFSENLAGTDYKGIYAVHSNDPTTGFSVDDGSYYLDGGGKGLFVVADPSRNSAPMLRTGFSTGEKNIKAARLYVTARGIYEIFINGKRVGDDYYNPGLTQYNVTHMYQTYDVTGMVKTGKNALGAMLGEGWWSGLLSFGNIWNHFGDRQSLLAKLVITYTDGSRNVITTNDSTWKYYNNGPIVYSSLDMGEIYDATREAEISGWSTPAFDDSNWKNAVVIPLMGTTFEGSSTERDGTVTSFDYAKMKLIGQIGNNAGILKEINARSVTEVRKNVFVYDLGQNIVGVPRIAIDNGIKGKKITLRYSETLYPDLKESGKNTGMIMTENYRAALSQDVYTMNPGKQVYQPKFTSHGFQYIEMTGIEEPLPLEAVRGVAISSVRELSADYSSSNPDVNKLWSNLVWSNIDNFLSIPTDCPQRNERMGWSGDINVFSRTATYVSNSDQFLTRHMLAMRDVQTPKGKFTDVAPVGGGFGGILWGSAGIVVPWEVWQQYGDKELLEEHYPAMVRYMEYLETTIDPKTGLSSDAQLGDWLGPQNNLLGSAFLATAYHAFDLRIMSEVARVLGKNHDAEHFRSLFEKRKEFFNKTFVNEEKKTLGLAGGGRGFGGQPAEPPQFKVADNQTSYAVGLAMDLFNDENKPYMVRNLASAIERKNTDDGGVSRPEYSLMTGFIGTAWISKALSDKGYSDLAYRLLQNDQYPSWIYPIRQGATTIWERLNGYTVENGFGGNNSMNSFNHYSFGAVGQWMMAHSLGIRRDEPGFRRFNLAPEPDPTGMMTSARGYYDSMYGRISSDWQVNGTILQYKAVVPANTSALLILPASSEKSITEAGKPVKKSKGVTFVNYENGKAFYELKSGEFNFTSIIK